jgi:hypothetical protein
MKLIAAEWYLQTIRGLQCLSELVRCLWPVLLDVRITRSFSLLFLVSRTKKRELAFLRRTQKKTKAKLNAPLGGKYNLEVYRTIVNYYLAIYR